MQIETYFYQKYFYYLTTLENHLIQMNKTMKAVVLHGAKDLRLEDFRMPDLLPGMVLLRIKRVGICGSDLHYYEHGYCGSFVPSQPFILGH